MLRLRVCQMLQGKYLQPRSSSPKPGSRKASKSSIQSTGDVALKSIQLQEGDSSKTAVIGASLGEK
jgi:hypothetical protein